MEASDMRLAGRQIYWIGTAVLVAAYVLVWLIHFRDVYGWLMDDRYVFLKGAATVRSFRNAFEGYNALQPYFFLVSYLPLGSGWTLPSFSLPEFGARTGQFRFLLLYAVFLHGLVAVSWAWFAEKLVERRLVAFLSTLLLITSPSFVLWTPQPDSRVLGLPLALLGMALMFGWKAPTPSRMFAAGSLLSLAQSIHYTALYLIVPVCIVFWLQELWQRRADWARMAAFVAGVLWLPVLLEGISVFIIRFPIQDGPFMTLLHLANGHRSVWTFSANIGMWIDWFRGEMGIALVASAAIGWVVFMRRSRISGPLLEPGRIVIGWAIPLALVWLCVMWGAQPMFRQTTTLQPFLFLFSAIAVLWASDWIFHDVRWRVLAVAVLTAAIGMVGWRESIQVFQAHLGLGRAINWAAAHHGNRQVYWLPIHWYPDRVSLSTLDDLAKTPPGSWLITYAPWSFFTDRPFLRAYFESTQPLAAFPTLYSTGTLRAELKARGNNDFRTDPLMAEARVFEISKLLEAMDGKPLEVESVTADSTWSAASEAVNVFDRDASPDQVLEWISAPTPAPHFLEMRFVHPVSLGEIQIVLPPTDRSTARISRLEIRIAAEQGDFNTVWSGAGLEKFPVIRARWKPQRFSRLRCVIASQMDPSGPVPQATIDEIVFPGYRVAAPKPNRTFAPLKPASLSAGSE
jgi:hypothetical protein